MTDLQNAGMILSAVLGFLVCPGIIIAHWREICPKPRPRYYTPRIGSKETK